MAYSLNFAEDFYCDCDPYEVQPAKNGKPKSVLQAIVSLDRAMQVEIAKEVMGSSNPEQYVDSEGFAFDVLDKVRETNTCSDLGTPIPVWIDDEGWYTVDVY
jgi:hypothetical protein